MIRPLKRAGQDLLSLCYPRSCCACADPLLEGEEVICYPCRQDLPRTNYHLVPGNPVLAAFAGRAALDRAASFLFFSKGGKTQNLMHALKYKGRREVGHYLGRLAVAEWSEGYFFREWDAVIPVPLHPRKERQRGYNQAQVLAQGVAQAAGLKLRDQVLYRPLRTATQTRKGRYERWLNVQKAFALAPAPDLVGASILLVDDVLTTGATLEGCIQSLQDLRPRKLGIFTLAYANR